MKLEVCFLVVVIPGEGNGNPLQCSCLENPRDGGAWWAAILGVAESRTQLKRLSSSSSSSMGADWAVSAHYSILGDAGILGPSSSSAFQLGQS